MSLTGHREKEKFSSSTLRYLSRKKIEILILAAFVIVAFMTGFFTVNKETVCCVTVEQATTRMPRFPSPSSILQHLTYFSKENPSKIEPNGGSDLGGYPSLKQRDDSFNIKELMTVHCGFVKGCRSGDETGFDIDVTDLKVLEQFHDFIVAFARKHIFADEEIE